MNRSVAAGAARVAGGALLAFAVLPVVLSGAAHAAEVPGPQATAYVDEVGIGTAVKIGNPAEVGVAKAAASATATATTEPDESTVTATPSDAVVIETESHQAGTEEPTEVGVLGTKVGTKVGGDGGTLAETGPGTVTIQALVALALIALGAALRGGPQLAVAVRRGVERRH